MVECAFFGEHDYDEAPISKIYLLSEDPPRNEKVSKQKIDMRPVWDDLAEHIENIKKVSASKVLQ